jgi:hypothetical protein
VNSRYWASLAIGVCLGASAFAADVVTRAERTDEPVLDPVPETERAQTPAPEPGPELAPVLEQVRAEDMPVNVRGNRMERKWRVIPFGRFRTIWDDNLFISNTNPQSDVSFTLSPGIAVGWGDYDAEVRQLGEFEHQFEPLSLNNEDTPQSFLFAKYAANAAFFIDHSGENALDHDALLAGRWESTKLTLGARLHFQTLSGADIDVGDRVKREVFTGAITSSYKFSEKTSADLNLYFNNYNYETQIDSTEWIVEDFFNYQLQPKTQISIGTRLGTTDIGGGSTQTYEQLVGRVAYNLSSKLALTLDGGVEWRQYENGPDEQFTVFNFATSYAPFDGTTFSVNAYRRNSASVSLVNENITSTGFNARLRQRVLHRFYFTVDGGFQNSKYNSTVTGAAGGRDDDTVYVKPGVSFDITRHVSAESAYQYQQNDSSLKETSFRENLVTFQLNLQF